MTLRKLRERAEFWPGILNLPEWRIVVRRPRGKEAKDCVGFCLFSAEELYAEIGICSGQGEDTLLHEMLHVLIDGHLTYQESHYSELHERAINRLAAGFMKLVSE